MPRAEAAGERKIPVRFTTQMSDATHLNWNATHQNGVTEIDFRPPPPPSHPSFQLLLYPFHPTAIFVDDGLEITVRRLRGSGGGGRRLYRFSPNATSFAEENCMEREPPQPSDVAVAGLAAAAVAAAAPDASVAS